MTREDALNTLDTFFTDIPGLVHDIVNQIFDDFEAQLKLKDTAISKENTFKQIADILQKFEASTNNEEIVGAIITLNDLCYSYNGERFIIVKEQ